jgi:calcium-dependent protein kinase
VLDNVCLQVQCVSAKERDQWIISISDVLRTVRASEAHLGKAMSHKEKYDMSEKTKLGEGQFGKVYKAVSKETGEYFAIKAIDRRMMLIRGVNLALIERELSVMMELDHPYIVKMDGYDVVENVMYIAMELCEGGELKQRIKQLGHYSQEEAKIVAQKLFEAVAFCHKRGILHRDLKPENILLKSTTSNTDIKLIDFGFSKG